MLLKLRPYIIGIFVVLSAASIYFASRLQFSFSFDQFFPEGDPDLEFYREFSKEFGTDDNFMLIALENKPDIFDSLFLSKSHAVALDLRSLPLIQRVQSLTTLELPVKTPFGLSLVPAIHLEQPEFYKQDKELIFKDKRWKFNLIDSAATSLVVAATTKENLTVQEAETLVSQVDSVLQVHQVSSKAHILGRSFFQKELIDFQKKEMALAFIASIFLVTIIMVILYRKAAGIIISLGSIALSLLLFLGYLGATGSELNAISALFPVIMLIVGSSDVIHIFSKYLDELEKNHDREEAMRITIREIGLATFMTSFTTAIGFASLATSRLHTIRDFGWDAAAGVMIAYITVIFLTTSLLSYFHKEQLFHQQRGAGKWEPLLQWLFKTNHEHGKKLFGYSFLLFVIFIGGISLIHTNYRIENNLPKKSRVLQDFLFFEKNYAGFRPMEFAITVKAPYKADDFEILQEIDRLETQIQSTRVIKSSLSLTSAYKSMHMMQHGNDPEYYRLPDSEAEFQQYRLLIQRFLKEESALFMTSDKSKTRISCRMQDLGAVEVKTLGTNLDVWIKTNISPEKISVRRTGTGIILDKNSEYVTENLLQGLVISVLLIGFLMALLFRSAKMLVIALIPNILPLLFAAALIGYMGIALEAGVAIMFTIIFGIAVDDTIHFLTRYKLCREKGMDPVTATRTTIMETGKAIIVTSVILFFGFFNMVFSTSPPTFTVGILISVTLLSALVFDILLLPALLMHFDKEDKNKPT